MSYDVLDLIIEGKYIDSDIYRRIDGESTKDRKNRIRRERYAYDKSFAEHRKNTHREWKTRSKENLFKTQENNRKSKYGMTKGMYSEMLISQSNKCKICKKEKKLFVDHNHRTGKIRGLICHACNTKLCAIEDLDYMKSAMEYLKEYGDI